MGLSTVFIVVVFTGLVSLVLYRHTVNLLTNNLRERLLSIVTTAVVQFDPKDIEKLKNETFNEN